jgi:MFS family permease
MLVSVTGYQIQQITLLWLVYDLTASPLYLGLVGGVHGIATIAFLLFGGVLADRIDRRRLLLATNFFFFFLLILIAISTAAQVVTVWHLLVYSLLSGAVTAFDQPTRHALLPHLLEDRRHLMNAIAMHSTIFQTARILGPAVAGILITEIGVAPCFFIAAGSYLAMVWAMTRVKVTVEGRREEQSIRSAIWQGVQYVRRNSIFSSVIGMVLVNSLFGMVFIYLMPVFAGEIFKVDSRGFGFLMTSVGLGTMAGTLLGATLGRFRKKNLLLLGGSSLFGLLLIFFSFSRVYIGSAVLIALAGVAQHVYMITAQTLLQSLVPDDVRGRVMAIYALVWSLGPVGSLQAGAIANYLGAPAAVAIGGAVVTGFTIFLLAAVPRLRKLEV